MFSRIKGAIFEDVPAQKKPAAAQPATPIASPTAKTVVSPNGPTATQSASPFSFGRKKVVEPTPVQVQPKAEVPTGDLDSVLTKRVESVDRIIAAYNNLESLVPDPSKRWGVVNVTMQLNADSLAEEIQKVDNLVNEVKVAGTAIITSIQSTYQEAGMANAQLAATLSKDKDSLIAQIAEMQSQVSNIDAKLAKCEEEHEAAEAQKELDIDKVDHKVTAHIQDHEYAKMILNDLRQSLYAV